MTQFWFDLHGWHTTAAAATAAFILKTTFSAFDDGRGAHRKKERLNAAFCVISEAVCTCPTRETEAVSPITYFYTSTQHFSSKCIVCTTKKCTDGSMRSETHHTTIIHMYEENNYEEVLVCALMFNIDMGMWCFILKIEWIHQLLLVWPPGWEGPVSCLHSGIEEGRSVHVLLSADVLVLLGVAGHLADANSVLDVFELQTQILACDGQHGPALSGSRLWRQLHKDQSTRRREISLVPQEETY